MLKIGIKGRIKNGEYASSGEVLIERAEDVKEGSYYIYIWPNDGTKWPDSDTDMVYDYWLEDLKGVEAQLKFLGFEIQWYDENPSSEKATDNNNDSSASNG
jgi:hypothetical protein